jgi:hypothetical protein
VNWAQAATIVVPITVALVGVLGAYFYNGALARRKDQLDRVNRQLSDLYGPLLALEAAASRSWEAFRTRYRPSLSYWREDPPPTIEEAEAWRLWMTEVFMPLNDRMAELVVTKADLLESRDIPACLLELVAHVESYRAVIASWKAGNYENNVAPLPFPGQAVREYAERYFSELKVKQETLLRVTQRQKNGLT